MVELLDATAGDVGDGADIGVLDQPPGELAQHRIGRLDTPRSKECRRLGQVTGQRVGHLRGLRGDIGRFPSRDHLAAYNGTAPIEVSSGGRRNVFRLSRCGNRRLNHAIHMAAVTPIRHRHSGRRVYLDRKIAEGHSGKEAIQALKRRISDAICSSFSSRKMRVPLSATTGRCVRGRAARSQA
jgi:Transposase IS116/IS110/IS902 family